MKLPVNPAPKVAATLGRFGLALTALITTGFVVAGAPDVGGWGGAALSLAGVGSCACAYKERRTLFKPTLALGGTILVLFGGGVFILQADRSFLYRIPGDYVGVVREESRVQYVQPTWKFKLPYEAGPELLQVALHHKDLEIETASGPIVLRGVYKLRTAQVTEENYAALAEWVGDSTLEERLNLEFSGAFERILSSNHWASSLSDPEELKTLLADELTDIPLDLYGVWLFD